MHIFLDYVTSLLTFQDSTNMSRQAAVCVALADCHCIPSFLWARVQQWCNSVIKWFGIQKTQKILQCYAKSDWDRTWQINIFLVCMPFLSGISAREKIRLGHSGKKWKMLNLFFQKNLIYGKTFFNNIPDLLLPQPKGETACHETPTSGCLPGNLKFLPCLGQTRDLQVSGLGVIQWFLNIKFNST